LSLECLHSAHELVLDETVEVTAHSLRCTAVIDRLVAAGCVAAEEEAVELVGAAPDDGTLNSWVFRREQGEPLAWITGTMEFCGNTIHVDPGVYVPRQQSEELARRATHLLAAAGGRAADLFTGSGAIAVHLSEQVRGSTVVGVDVDERAVACARRNGVNAVRGDLGEALGPDAFDVVTAVAPYVPTAELKSLPRDVQHYEPRRALDGGSDGLDLVRRTVAEAGRILRRDGWLLLELGADQDQKVIPMLVADLFGCISTWCDEDGDLRGLAAQAVH